MSSLRPSKAIHLQAFFAAEPMARIPLDRLVSVAMHPMAMRMGEAGAPGTLLLEEAHVMLWADVERSSLAARGTHTHTSTIATWMEIPEIAAAVVALSLRDGGLKTKTVTMIPIDRAERASMSTARSRRRKRPDVADWSWDKVCCLKMKLLRVASRCAT
jgi:hypothetical protein